jgi:hypothetical protein
MFRCGMELLVPSHEVAKDLTSRVVVCIECGHYKIGVGWPACEHDFTGDWANSYREFSEAECIFSRDGSRVVGIRRSPGTMHSPNVGISVDDES